MFHCFDIYTFRRHADGEAEDVRDVYADEFRPNAVEVFVPGFFAGYDYSVHVKDKGFCHILIA